MNVRTIENRDGHSASDCPKCLAGAGDSQGYEGWAASAARAGLGRDPRWRHTRRGRQDRRGNAAGRPRLGDEVQCPRSRRACGPPSARSADKAPQRAPGRGGGPDRASQKSCAVCLTATARATGIDLGRPLGSTPPIWKLGSLMTLASTRRTRSPGAGLVTAPGPPRRRANARRRTTSSLPNVLDPWQGQSSLK